MREKVLLAFLGNNDSLKDAFTLHSFTSLLSQNESGEGERKRTDYGDENRRWVSQME